MKITLSIFCFIIVSNFTNAQWQQTNGLAGERIDCFAIKDSMIVAGTCFSGVFISSNNGADWIEANNGLTDTYIHSLTFYEEEIIAGTFSKGIFKTANFGNTWTTFNTGLNDSIISALVVCDSTLFAGTGNGKIFTCSNNIWIQSNVPFISKVNALDVSGINIYAASYGEGVFVSTDKGLNWTPRNNGLLNENKEITQMAAKDSIVVIGTSYSGSGIFVSTDYGVNWTLKNNGFPGNSPASINSIEISESKIYVGVNSSGVYVSSNNGDNWMPSYGVLHSDVYALACRDSNVFAGSGSGISLSNNNGGNWKAINNGFPPNSIIEFLTTIGDTIFASGRAFTGGYTYLGVHLSLDSGNTWTTYSNGLLDKIVRNIGVKNNIIYAAGNYLFKSEDGCNTWSYLSGLGMGGVANILIKDNLFFCSSGGGSSVQGAWISHDYGFNWNQINNGLNGINATIINSMLLCGTNILASTYAGLYITTDNGNNWTLVNNSFGESIVTNGVNTFTSSGNEIYVSIDDGITWTLASNSLPSGVNTLEIKGNKLFAGTYNGIFFSNDLGFNWINISDGLPVNTRITKLNASETYLYAGTEKVGIWKRLLSNINGIVNNNTIEINLTIYPNPTKGLITIEAKGIIGIEVMDFQGRTMINTVIASKAKQSANNSEITTSCLRRTRNDEIDLSQNPKGIYIIKVTTEKGVAVGKVVLE